MRIIKLKNAQETEDTWYNTTIDAGEYSEELTEIERAAMSLDYKVNQDLWSSPAKLVINDGENDLDSVSGDNWLKGNITQSVINEPANTFTMQMVAKDATATKNSTTSIDFKIENYTDFPNTGQDESFTSKYIWGGKLITKNAVHGDYAVFLIVDVDNILGYGAGFIAKEYIKKVFIDPDRTMEFKSFSPGEIPIGLYLRCKYTSIGTENDVKAYINYELHTKG